VRYPGQHQPIVERSVWDKTQELLRLHAVRADGKPSGSVSSPLTGKLFDDKGERLTPSHANRGARSQRFDSAVIISTSCRRRITSAINARL
jgi:site-specific DNA recombinase